MSGLSRSKKSMKPFFKHARIPFTFHDNIFIKYCYAEKPIKYYNVFKIIKLHFNRFKTFVIILSG
ncbi:hypothetical protein MMKA1_11720 [Methanococcus maripaludis KA1]|uniref:Uncharacterized protein n=1 Tax=Methanococcus maripaludis KA1 TaxID=637914 RepID=A0A2Z5PDK8_METMI|nr:hypothetical protein MMKA1_11720 [Methanococcus maripaludis KA1]